MADSQKLMSVPMAIIVAGALIAGAVYFSRTAPLPAQQNPSISNPPAPTPSLAIREISTNDHVRGPQNAKLTVVEYSDLECPYCKVFHQTMLEVMKNYPDSVRWVYRHSPIPELHSKAPAEANAAECAAAQGKFWEFTDVIFAATKSNDYLNLADMKTYAGQAGVTDLTAFQACVDGNTYKTKVDADTLDGANAGLTGTPFNMIITPDGKKMQLGGGIQYPQMKQIVDSLLN